MVRIYRFPHLNSSNIKCQDHWIGQPKYHDGEYEYGCEDKGENDNTLCNNGYKDYQESDIDCGGSPVFNSLTRM